MNHHPPDEFRESSPAGSFSARQQEVILLVHGIRTFAGWQPMVQRVLQEIPHTKVIPIKYGYLDAFRFWFPVFTRQAAIDELRREIQNAKALHPDARLSVIAHSFGTYAISRILVENPDLELHRLILSGAIIPRSYRWDYVRGRLATEVLNDYGTRDIWPVLAKCLSWGYGDTGRHGFGRTGIMDRGHNYAHSDFFNEKFVRAYWKPWFENDMLVPSPWEEQAPPPSWLLSVLSVVPLQWIICLLLIAAGTWLGLDVFRRAPAIPTTPTTQTNGESLPFVSADSGGAADDRVPTELEELRYYVKELPEIAGEDGKRLIASAMQSWEAASGIRGVEVLQEEEATVVLELGPLPFVSVDCPDDAQAAWRVYFSKQEPYDAARLEAAACHAFGRVFGLGYSADPADVMFDYVTDPHAPRARRPSPHDIREIQDRR